MSTVQKSPLPSSVHAAANNLIDRLNTISETMRTASDKYINQPIDEEEHVPFTSPVEDDSNEQADDQEDVPEDDVEDIQGDINRLALEEAEDEIAAECLETQDSFQSSTDEKEVTIESVAASLVDDAIKGIVVDELSYFIIITFIIAAILS